jgi:thiol-disulfide isomerase/thioredoxin
MANPGVIFAAAAAGLAYWFLRPRTADAPPVLRASPPLRAITRSQPRFLMFYVDWCPHCREALPEFEQLAGTQTLGMTAVDFVLVDHDKSKSEWSDYDVRGYPTMILETSNGTRVPYTGPRTAAAIIEFVQRSL